MEIELIGVPLYYGCDNPGTHLAWNTFLNNGLPEMIVRHGHTLSKITEIKVPTASNIGINKTMKYLEEVRETMHQLEDVFSKSLGSGHFPLVIGGDHSLSIGSIAGLNHCLDPKDISVVWVDAHTDINTNLTSQSHNIHGMPLAAALGLGDSILYDGLGKTKPPFILPQNLYYIGSRSIDDGELNILKELGIKPYGMDYIRKNGIVETTLEVLAKITTPHIHVSFDVDFMDSALYTATGLPVADGPSIEDTGMCLKTLLANKKIVSMDFVEYSPVHDTADMKGLGVCFSLLDVCLRWLA